MLLYTHIHTHTARWGLRHTDVINVVIADADTAVWLFACSMISNPNISEASDASVFLSSCSNYRPDLKPDLKPDLRPELRPDLETDLRPDLEPELRPDLRLDLWPDLKPDLRPDLRPDLGLNLGPDLSSFCPTEGQLSSDLIWSKTPGHLSTFFQ